MRKTQTYYLVLAVLSVLLLFGSLGKNRLWMYDEAKNAECAREMLKRNDWIVPTFNNELRTDKPPLHYFFMKGGYLLFGTNETGARFFSAFFGVLTILTLFYFINKFSTTRQALITSLILLTSTHFLFEFRVAVPDPYLIFFNLLAVLAGYSWFTEKKLKWLFLTSLGMGFGALSKGPVGIALPCLVLFVWLLWEGKLRDLLNSRHLVAALLVLIIAVPWFLLVHKATGGAYTQGFFINHNLNRFSATKEGHGGIFLLIPAFVLLGMLPASAYTGGAVSKVKRLASHSLVKLAVSGVLCFLVFYSFSQTKLPNYPMPCYPFLAILLGYYIDTLINQAKKQAYPFIILAILYSAITYFAYVAIREEVNTKGLEWLSLFILIVPAGAAAAAFVVKKKGIIPALMLFFSFMCVFNLVFFNFLHPAVYRNTPIAEMLPEIQQSEKIVAYGNFHPSFVFYAKNPIQKFENADSLSALIKKEKVLVITRADHYEEIKNLSLKKTASIHNLFEKPTTVILSNK